VVVEGKVVVLLGADYGVAVEGGEDAADAAIDSLCKAVPGGGEDEREEGAEDDDHEDGVVKDAVALCERRHDEAELADLTDEMPHEESAAAIHPREGAQEPHDHGEDKDGKGCD
jgi:hypothetical protein